MKKAMAIALRTKADRVANMFSRKDRGGNYANETFRVERIEVLSEGTAIVIFRKEPTDKQAAAWFYYVNSKAKPRWEYFFVTYDHLTGLERAKVALHRVEQHNFKRSTGEV